MQLHTYPWLMLGIFWFFFPSLSFPGNNYPLMAGERRVELQEKVAIITVWLKPMHLCSLPSHPIHSCRSFLWIIWISFDGWRCIYISRSNFNPLLYIPLPFFVSCNTKFWNNTPNCLISFVFLSQNFCLLASCACSKTSFCSICIYITSYYHAF